MTRATLTLPNGTKVTVEGDPAEIEAILRSFGAAGVESVRDAIARAESAAPPTHSRRQTAREPGGPTGHIRNLKTEGFFREKRSLTEIRKKLEEIGHIYASHDLSPRLVRLVRERELRRVREAGTWKYVNP